MIKSEKSAQLLLAVFICLIFLSSCGDSSKETKTPKSEDRQKTEIPAAAPPPPEPEAGVKPEPEPAVQPESEAKEEIEPAPEPEADVKPEPEVVAKSVPEPEPAPEPKSSDKPEPEVKPVVKAVPVKLPGTAAVTITNPANGSMVASPVLVCMGVHGIEVEPAKKGVNQGKGHHHILVDTAIPEDLSKPIGKDATHIHMGDGSTCKALTLSAGTHVVRTLFAKGNHVPYDPPLTATVVVNVK